MIPRLEVEPKRLSAWLEARNRTASQFCEYLLKDLTHKRFVQLRQDLKRTEFDLTKSEPEDWSRLDASVLQQAWDAIQTQVLLEPDEPSHYWHLARLLKATNNFAASTLVLAQSAMTYKLQYFEPSNTDQHDNLYFEDMESTLALSAIGFSDLGLPLSAIFCVYLLPNAKSRHEVLVELQVV